MVAKKIEYEVEVLGELSPEGIIITVEDQYSDRDFLICHSLGWDEVIRELLECYGEEDPDYIKDVASMLREVAQELEDAA